MTTRILLPLAVCHTRTGKMTHLGWDSPAGGPGVVPGEPELTVCGRSAVPLPIDTDPWTGVAAVECRRCLAGVFSSRLICLPTWSAKVAEALRGAHWRLRQARAIATDMDRRRP